MPRRNPGAPLLNRKKRDKKIVIRPYQKPPQLPSNYYEETSSKILQGTLDVLKARLEGNIHTNLSLQNAYTNVVHLVSHQYGARLYGDVVDTMKKAVEYVLHSGNTDLLNYVTRQYKLYTEYLQLLQHIFLPLDRTWQWIDNRAVQQNGSYSLWQVGLTVFLKRLQELGYDSRLYSVWKKELLSDWNGGAVLTSDLSARQCLQQVWYMWQDLGILGSLSLQTDLEAYWAQQSAEWKRKDYDLSGFLQFAYSKHLHCTNWRPWLPIFWMWKILDVHLITPHLNADYLLNDAFLHPVLAAYVFEHRTETSLLNSPIQQLWFLAGRVPKGQAQVAKAVQRFACVQGSQRVASKTSAIPELLDLQDKLNALIQQLPDSNTISLKSVWEEVVNVDADPPLAEQLAKFLDGILKTIKKIDQYQNHYRSNASNDDYAWLQRIVSGLFVPLQAKDVFEAFYKKDLAKRLIWNRVVNMDLEKQVCVLLKAECGAGYTSKMDGMFQDIDWSRENMRVYKESVVRPQGSVDVEVQVLTTGYWPVYPQYPNLNLPDSLKEPQEQFATYYRTKYQGRRMTWQFSLGHCVVRTHGFSKPYDFVVSLCQALVLIQFTAVETKLTLPQLLQAVGLEDRDEMERLLQSLSLGKDGTRILRKIDFDAVPGKKKKTRMNADDRDTFVINSSFESNARRIRITNVMMKETKDEREKTVEGVSRDRLYLIDAVLVRIMKSRKTILHKDLIPQVLEQVKLPAQPADVKKRIESLIERDYLERDAHDRNRYNYLA